MSAATVRILENLSKTQWNLLQRPSQTLGFLCLDNGVDRSEADILNAGASAVVAALRAILGCGPYLTEGTTH